jgi:outer membrane protein assembly factor BamB
MFPVGTSPLLEDNLLIIAVGGRKPKSGIAAFDVETGQTVWTVTDDRRSFATPVVATIHGRRHVFVLTHEGLVSLNPASGEMNWRVPFRPKNPDVLMATTPVVHGDLVFVSAYQCGAMCLRVLPDGGCEKLWSDRRSLDSQHNNLIYRDGCVLGFSAREHVLGCVELRTGKWGWKWDSELDRGCLLAYSDRLIVFSEKGQLGVLSVLNDSCQYESLTTALLPGPCYSAPAISSGRMFLRNEKTLACFDLSHKSARVVPSNPR